MIYLVHTTADPEAIERDGGVDEVQPMTDGLLLIESDLTRSKLYHRLKALQGRDLPLLVVSLRAVPKFKGMAPGALAWARDRLPSA